MGTGYVTGRRCLQHGHAVTSLHCVSPPWAACPIYALPPSPSQGPHRLFLLFGALHFRRPALGPPALLALCAAPSSPSAQGLWARVCRGVPPTNLLPSPQSELVGQLGSVPGMELAICGHLETSTTMPHRPAARPLGIPWLGAAPAPCREGRVGERMLLSPGTSGVSTILTSCLRQCWALLVPDNAGTAQHRLLQCRHGVLMCPFTLLTCVCSKDCG